jgi:hypothetical protein
MRERALLNKYPTKADHDRKRQVEVAEAQRKIGRHQGRLKELGRDRKRLEDEKEFYPSGTKMPGRLKLDLDSNEAAVSAQKDLIQTEHDELARNQKRLDDELLILNDLWNSAPRWTGGTKK